MFDIRDHGGTFGGRGGVRKGQIIDINRFENVGIPRKTIGSRDVIWISKNLTTHEAVIRYQISSTTRKMHVSKGDVLKTGVTSEMDSAVYPLSTGHFAVQLNSSLYKYSADMVSMMPSPNSLVLPSATWLTSYEVNGKLILIGKSLAFFARVDIATWTLEASGWIEGTDNNDRDISNYMWDYTTSDIYVHFNNSGGLGKTGKIAMTENPYFTLGIPAVSNTYYHLTVDQSGDEVFIYNNILNVCEVYSTITSPWTKKRSFKIVYNTSGQTVASINSLGFMKRLENQKALLVYYDFKIFLTDINTGAIIKDITPGGVILPGLAGKIEERVGRNTKKDDFYLHNYYQNSGTIEVIRTTLEVTS